MTHRITGVILRSSEGSIFNSRIKKFGQKQILPSTSERQIKNMLLQIKNSYHFFLAWLGSVIYRNPSRELMVIGVTGTKGKTTSVELLRAVLHDAGKKTAMLSSAGLSLGDKVVARSGNTMPGRFFIQRFLRQAVESGCTHAVFEVTSQGVVQFRHRFIDFDVAAITNLHPEHIESHGSYEAYRAAKTVFFRDVARRSSKPGKMFFINSEMVGGDAEFFEEAVRHPLGKGPFGEVAYYNYKDFVRNDLHCDLTRVGDWLRSSFNLENASLVYSIAHKLGVTPDSILKTFTHFKGVPGRMQFITGGGKTVVIDYALTPESLRALYQHLSTAHRLPSTAAGSGRLIAVFGSAGGGRDTWKRSALGKIADEFCEQIYLTSDDSYDEDPQKIIKEIMVGVNEPSKCVVVVDRREAIQRAIEEAGTNDIVVITGMGSQSYMYGPHGKKLPWSDKEVAERALFSLS